VVSTTEVAQEARQQARDLLGEGRTQVREQARAGQQRAASGLTSLADELREMADKGGQSGVASELARQASEKVQTFASWLERREPGELLDEARRWARQRPGAFLLGAALAGVVAGRLTSGVVAAQRESTGGDVGQRFASDTGYGAGYSSTGYSSGAAYGSEWSAASVPPVVGTQPVSSDVPPASAYPPPATGYPAGTGQAGYPAGTGETGYETAPRTDYPAGTGQSGYVATPPEQYQPEQYQPEDYGPDGR
jgi:hypothetical protein